MSNRESGIVRVARLAGVVGIALLLGACAGSPYRSEKAPVEPSEPPARTAPPPSGPVITPPPYGQAHWDNRLGVYVVEGTELFYRDRLYYRWDGDWFCAGRPDGPWEPVAPPSVPPGLRSYR